MLVVLITVAVHQSERLEITFTDLKIDQLWHLLELLEEIFMALTVLVLLLKGPFMCKVQIRITYRSNLKVTSISLEYFLLLVM
jgi:hypothetical protein